MVPRLLIRTPSGAPTSAATLLVWASMIGFVCNTMSGIGFKSRLLMGENCVVEGTQQD